MRTRILEAGFVGPELVLSINDRSGGNVVLDEYEIIELSGITADLAAKIQQRRAVEKKKS